ncbi:N-acetyltransferase [Ramlibacter tataouinensis]|nr:N-acetyltransferase [Ramlibacter tataouinensis]WBY04057.1 N-acetyltransferase [Ramlibacter tataouinensis]
MPTGPRGLDTRADLRIDVDLRPEDLEGELDNLYRRLRTPGDAMFGSATAPINLPGLMFRTREADGETYVYVEDVVHARLAGYTVFNRLVELNRRADRHLRAPHSRYSPDYQRRGIATAVYEWGLGGGLCLISGARQSAGAHGLWRALARRRELIYVDVRDKALRCLGSEVDDAVLDELHTRMVMLGNGWTLEGLCAATGMRPLAQQAEASNDPVAQEADPVRRPRPRSRAAASSR